MAEVQSYRTLGITNEYVEKQFFSGHFGLSQPEQVLG
jgi:hypothetical protein